MKYKQIECLCTVNDATNRYLVRMYSFQILTLAQRKTNNGKRKLAMVKETGPFCVRCKEWIELDYLTVDHIIPRKMGLPSRQWQSESNRQLVCLQCQYIKSVLEQAFKRRIPSRKKRYLLFEKKVEFS